jgi:hypothetical protein
LPLLAETVAEQRHLLALVANQRHADRLLQPRRKRCVAARHLVDERIPKV